MTSDNSETLVRLSEDDARYLLADAIRLQHSLSSGMSLIEIRLAAAEVGVGEDAFRAAVTRFGERHLAPSRPVGYLRRLLRKYADLGISVALLTQGLGLLTSTNRPLIVDPLLTMVVLLLSGIAARPSPQGAGRGFLEFQSRNLGLWLGYGAAAVFLSNTLRTVWVLDSSSMIVLWLLSSVVGGLAAAWQSRKPHDVLGGTQHPWRKKVSAYKRRLVDRFNSILGTIVRRSGILTH